MISVCYEYLREKWSCPDIHWQEKKKTKQTDKKKTKLVPDLI